MITLRKLTRAEVDFIVAIEPENMPVVGAFDDSRDTADILERLSRGETEAWCTVKVTARWASFTAVDYLGGCSLDTRYTAAVAAEEHGMHEEALARLNQALADVATALSPLEQGPIVILTEQGLTWSRQ